ncbi:hypothetical protein PV08_06820 [Exophiala spinifera]|uniref:Uncharacterized protein n=1 Tax=Exophiala spinifera TaxID=91928 RepID=A0A0D2BS63_9EURO|nr:uncharacterized protein PV08_06820 [Exophiala spinifera]KIW14039.1 hypothetical protein PV08_06820 [Exophiala spinifera]
MTTSQSPSILRQPAREWTVDNLNFLQVNDPQPFTLLSNIAAGTVEDIAKLEYLSIPTEHMLDFYSYISQYFNHPFRQFFTYLEHVLEIPDDPRIQIRLLRSLVDTLWCLKNRRFLLFPQIFERLKIGCQRIKCDGLFEPREPYASRLIPVVAFLALEGSEDDRIHEIQQLLAQAVLAFKYRPKMDEFTSFVMCSIGAAVYLAGACVTRAYFECLRDDQQPRQRLHVHHSPIYDLTTLDGRKDISLLLLKMLNYVHDRDHP